MYPELKYIGRKVSIKTIRNCILDNSLHKNDAILLNPKNIDEIKWEYQKSHHKSISVPLLYLGVVIQEDEQLIVPQNKVGIIRNFGCSLKTPFPIERNVVFNEQIVIYRCVYCKVIVDEFGRPLSADECEEALLYINNSPFPNISFKLGKCCSKNHV